MVSEYLKLPGDCFQHIGDLQCTKAGYLKFCLLTQGRQGSPPKPCSAALRMKDPKKTIFRDSPMSFIPPRPGHRAHHCVGIGTAMTFALRFSTISHFLLTGASRTSSTPSSSSPGKTAFATRHPTRWPPGQLRRNRIKP